MPSRLSFILTHVTRFALLGIVFLVPLFYFPKTAETVELPKQFLLIILTLVALTSWIGNVVTARKLEFARTPFDIPLAIFWVTLLLSTLTSRDRISSLLGNFESYTWSFLTITSLVVVFYLIVQTVRSRSEVMTLLTAFAASGIVAELFFILKTLLPKLVAWIPLASSNPVSALSSVFGLFVLVQMILALSILAVKGKVAMARDVFFGIVFGLSLITLLLIGFKTVWFLVAVGMFFFLIYAVGKVGELRLPMVSASFALFVAAILLAFFGVPRFLTARLPVEVSLAAPVSWNITTNVLTSDVKSFLLGSGPASFVLDFSRFRPESFNNNFAWNVRFSQPYSTALELLAATGVLGAIAFASVVILALGTIFVLWVRKVAGRRGAAADEGSHESMPLFWGVTTAWVTMLVAAFFSVYGATSWLVFVILLGIMASLARVIMRREDAVLRVSLKTSPQYSLLVSFCFIVVFTAVVIFGLFMGRFFKAEIAYASGLRALVRGASEEAVTQTGKAVSLHPTRSIYHIALAQAYLNRATQVASGGGADPNLVTTLVALAVNEARRSTELAPNNVGGWQQLANMYANARAIAPDANTWVMRSLERAIELEKSNPILYVLLGNAKAIDRQPEEAIKNYEKAIQLKPDYVDAYLNLALLEEQQGKIDEAINHLAQAVLVSPQNTDALFNAGRLLYNRGKEGDLKRAETAFQTVLNIVPNHANALFSLGLLSERQGKIQNAIEFYRRVLELNPDNADVKRKLDSLSAPPTPVTPEEPAE